MIRVNYNEPDIVIQATAMSLACTIISTKFIIYLFIQFSSEASVSCFLISNIDIDLATVLITDSNTARKA